MCRRQTFWLLFKAAASEVMWHHEMQLPIEIGAGKDDSWGHRKKNLKIGIVQEQRRRREGTDFYTIIVFK